MTTIPTLSQLYTAVLTDLETQYGVTISLFGKVFLRALAAVQAGKIKLLYLVLGNLQKNIFVDTADPEALGGTLERFGRVKLNRNPFPAVAGQYEAIVTGSIGAVIPASTTFKSDDDSLNPGFLFILDNAFTLTATTDTITIRALTSGLVSKLAVGNTLTATQPIALVDSSIEIDTETVPPLAAETIEEYRQKAIQAYQLEAQGGAATDYRLWSYDVQGVKQAYPYAKSGDANVVDVFVEATVADSTDTHGTPSDSMLAEVREVIEFDPDTTQPTNDRGRRPLAVYAVNTLPVLPKPIAIEIVGFQNLTADIQSSIETAIRSAIDKVRPFVAGCDVLADKNDVLDLYRISYAILSVAPGSIFTSINLYVDSVAVSTYTFDQGIIPYYDTVTFI